MMANKFPEKITTDNGELYVTGSVDTNEDGYVVTNEVSPSNVVNVSHYGDPFETTHLKLYRDQAAVMAYELLFRCEISEDVLKLVEAEMQTLKNTEGEEARKATALAKRRSHVSQTYFQMDYDFLDDPVQRLVDDYIDTNNKMKEASNVG